MFEFFEPLFLSFLKRLTRRRPRTTSPGLFLKVGYRVAEGQVTKRPVHISLRLRSMHTAIVGKSGSGKTSYLKHDCACAVKASRGFFVVDLHGDLTPFILGVIAAEERQTGTDLSERLIVISPSDRDTSVGLNPLEGVGSDFARASEIAQVLRQHSHQDYLGPRTEELLRNAVVVLSANRLSLVDLVPLFANARFRAKCVANTPNAEVRAFFESRYERASDAFKATMAEPILNKTSQFTADPHFRHIIGQVQSTFSLKDAMDRGCWVIAYLPKGQLGGQTLTFASLLFTVVKNAIFAREHRSLYTLVLDEAHNLVSQSGDIEAVLAEARKFGVGMILANQYLDQYPTSMRAAILSVANFVCFQLSSADATTVAQILDGGKSLAEHIKNLDQRHFILKSGSDHWREVCVPDVQDAKATHSDLLNRSRAHYARPRAEIESEILERHSQLAEPAEEDLHGWD